MSAGPAICVIPARGGSKRIPRKNIKPFRGTPALGWPLSAIRAAGVFGRIVLTTDDTEIAEIGERLGAEVPFLRDPALSDDHAGTIEVIRDAVVRLDIADDTPVCCVYPTALLLRSADLIEGLERLWSGAEWVLSVGEYATPIDRAYRREGDRLVPRQREMMPKRSQDLEPAYFDAGQFYWARAARWRDPIARIWDGAAGVVLPPERSVDVDTPDDWARAERLAELLERDD